MRKTLRLPLLLAFCLSCAVQQNPNISKISDEIETKTVKQENQNDSSVDRTSQTWELRETETASIVSISGTIETPTGPIQTLFLMRCAKTENGVSDFNYIVRDSGQIPNFNFGYFEGPNAPAQKKQLVSIEASNTEAKMTWRFSVSGRYGCNDEANAFCFSENLENIPDPLAQVAHFIAKGQIVPTFTVSDNQNVIKNKFPPIDPTSEAAKVLKSCRL